MLTDLISSAGLGPILNLKSLFGPGEAVKTAARTSPDAILLAQANATAPKSEAKPAGALITWPPTLVQDLDRHEGGDWRMADWSNGDVFNCDWQPDNISFKNGIMTLTLDDKGCPGGCDGYPYASGEYRTSHEKYGYGYYEARMKAARGDGLVTSFFNYAGKWGKEDHVEIDFEVLGRDCTMVQTNFYAHGTGKDNENKEMIDLGFNACTGMHNYGFRWDKDSIVWYVDGKQVRQASSKEFRIPQGDTNIMVNLWPGIDRSDILGWLNAFTYPGQPIKAEYDWIKFSPIDKAPASPANGPVRDDAAVRPDGPSSANAVMAHELETGHNSWNGGRVSVDGGVYTFTAKGAKDPGFTISFGNLNVSDLKTFKFEAKGSLTKLGNYARFAAQVYSIKDSDASPSLSIDPVTLSDGEWRTFEVPLADVASVKKVQFILITDSGDINAQIRNARFE